MGTLSGQWAEFFAIRISDRLLVLALGLANWVERRQSRQRARQRAELERKKTAGPAD